MQEAKTYTKLPCNISRYRTMRHGHKIMDPLLFDKLIMPNLYKYEIRRHRNVWSVTVISEQFWALFFGFSRVFVAINAHRWVFWWFRHFPLYEDDERYQIASNRWLTLSSAFPSAVPVGPNRAGKTVLGYDFYPTRHSGLFVIISNFGSIMKPSCFAKQKFMSKVAHAPTIGAKRPWKLVLTEFQKLHKSWCFS